MQQWSRHIVILVSEAKSDLAKRIQNRFWTSQNDKDMISLIQRVTSGAVTIDNELFSQIKAGYVILLGIFESDSEKEADKLVDKILNLRIMADEQDKMNRSIIDTKGELLVVSQFTLCADLTFGRRPSFIKAMKPDKAEKLYEYFVAKISKSGLTIKTGKFGAMMQVNIVNDGPTTIIIDSAK